MTRLWMKLIVITALLAVLGACGQKGPLYLPDLPDDNSGDDTAAEPTS